MKIKIYVVLNGVTESIASAGTVTLSGNGGALADDMTETATGIQTVSQQVETLKAFRIWTISKSV